MAITPIWMAGAETGSSALKEFTSVTGGLAASTTQAYTGDYSFKFPRNDQGLKGAVTIPDTNQARSGWWIIPQTGGYSTAEILRIYNSGSSTPIFALRAHKSGANFSINVNGSLKDTMPEEGLGAWHNWGVDCKVDAINGWFKVYIDGILKLSFEGNTGTAAMQSFSWGTSPAPYFYDGDCYMDDLYIDDTTGEAAAACPPTKRFSWHPATADVAQNFTPSTGADHFALVDEIPVSGTDYLSTAAAGTVDTFTIGSATYPAGFEVKAVWPTAYAFKSDAGTDSQLTLRVSDGVTDDDGTSTALPTTQGVITERFALQPDGAAWTNADVLTTDFGFVSSGDF